MARKARQRISYVIPLPQVSGGHQAGVNVVAVDETTSTVYSGGRDGQICLWDAEFNKAAEQWPLTSEVDKSSPKTIKKGSISSGYKYQIRPHTDWINDLILTRNNGILVSASSDLSVKVWQTRSESDEPAQTVGLHEDYVKCLAVPHDQSDWVASGGLDRKLCVWDLNGAGEKLSINAGEDEENALGSIYALGAGGNILATGGPESIVRIWDPRSGQRVTRFIGHTDGIRSILVSADGDKVMSASSDTTIKIWSVTAGRCLHTLTMHNESVWSLFSKHPDLSVFHSADRSGLVAKTDVRDIPAMEDGLCVAICREHGGVSKLAAAGGLVWTCTSNNSFHSWKDVDTMATISAPDTPSAVPRHTRTPSVHSRQRAPSSPHPPGDGPFSPPKDEIPLSSLLRLSETPRYTASKDADAITIYSVTTVRKNSEAIMFEAESAIGVPLRNVPYQTMEGQHGLIKFELLNNRQHVLASDSAGEITLWDIIQCKRIKSFGKGNFEEVKKSTNVPLVVPNWCSIDIRTGSLQVNLDENYCFDAEVYADEQALAEDTDYKEDHRINLGKWVLRYLFEGVLDEEIRRDRIFRLSLEQTAKSKLQRGNAPDSIQLPVNHNAGPTLVLPTKPFARTPGMLNPITPGSAIGLATPAPPPPKSPLLGDRLPRTSEESSRNGRSSMSSQPRSSVDKPADYFSNPASNNPVVQSPGGSERLATRSEAGESATSPAPEGEKEGQKEGGFSFGKFKMPFGKRVANADKKRPGEDKAEEVDDQGAEETKAEAISNNMRGVIQKIRQEYRVPEKDDQEPISTLLTPAATPDTPLLKLPKDIIVLIQEERPHFGSYRDLHRTTVGETAIDTDRIEQAAPSWVADYLLLNRVPYKDMVKISFMVSPWNNLLPSVSPTPETSRLNANRMLRARKILIYVAEKLDPPYDKNDPDAERPEDYLELFCDGKPVPLTMTLATMRKEIWNNRSPDVEILYKKKGNKVIRGEKVADSETESET